jgi:hypothetical protein
MWASKSVQSPSAWARIKLAATTGAGLVGYGATTVAAFLTALQAAAVGSGAALVAFINSGTGATARTAQAKMRDVCSPFDFGAVGDGATDDTVALQAALDSGHPVIDGHGYTFATTAAITVNADTHFRNFRIAMDDANYAAVLLESDATITDFVITGTSRTNQYPSAQRGVALASAGRSNVHVDGFVEDCTTNFDFDGVLYSRIVARSLNASGQTGVSEGYGLLMYQGASHNIVDLIARGSARHNLYVSSGSSYNDFRVRSFECPDNFAVQINSRKDQAPCIGNTFTGSDYNSAGGIVFAMDATANPDTGGHVSGNVVQGFTVTAGANTLYSAFLLTMAGEGTTPARGNKFIDCMALGVFPSTGLGVMHLSGGTDSTIRGYDFKGTCANVTQGALIIDGTNGHTRVSGVNQDLTGSSASVIGIYANVVAPATYSIDNLKLTQPGATFVFESGSTLDQRRGVGNAYHAVTTVTAIGATANKNGTVTLPADVLYDGHYSIQIVSQSVTATAASGAAVISLAGSTLTFQVYNGHSAQQDITVHITVEGLPG